jgi:N-acetylglutamate synthase-like GNAT family acetyltransferase
MFWRQVLDYIIRPARQEDWKALVDCVEAAYSKYIERIGTKPAPMLADYMALIVQRKVWLLLVENEVRGVLVMMPEGESLFVENIAVDPRYQGQGFGHVLMAFVEQQAREAQLK